MVALSTLSKIPQGVGVGWDHARYRHPPTLMSPYNPRAIFWDGRDTKKTTLFAIFYT